MAWLQRGTLICLGLMLAWIGYMKLLWQPRHALPFQPQRPTQGSLSSLNSADFEPGGIVTKTERAALLEACEIGIAKKFEAEARTTICQCVADAAADTASRFDRLANTRYFFNVSKERASTVVRDLKSSGKSDDDIAPLLAQARKRFETIADRCAGQPTSRSRRQRS